MGGASKGMGALRTAQGKCVWATHRHGRASAPLVLWNCLRKEVNLRICQKELLNGKGVRSMIYKKESTWNSIPEDVTCRKWDSYRRCNKHGRLWKRKRWWTSNDWEFPTLSNGKPQTQIAQKAGGRVQGWRRTLHLAYHFKKTHCKSICKLKYLGEESRLCLPSTEEKDGNSCIRSAREDLRAGKHSQMKKGIWW